MLYTIIFILIVSAKQMYLPLGIIIHNGFLICGVNGNSLKEIIKISK